MTAASVELAAGLDAEPIKQPCVAEEMGTSSSAASLPCTKKAVQGPFTW